MFPSEKASSFNAVPLLVIALTIVITELPVFSGPPEIIWERNLLTEFNNRFWGIDCTDDGGAICVGELASEDEEITSLLLAKYTSQGLLQWKTVTGWSLGSAGYDVLQVPGGYIVCGSIFSGSDYDGLLAKFDYFGNIIWHNHVENPNDDILYDVVMAGDSCYAATGYTKSTGAGQKDAWLVLFDFNGNLLWSRAFGTSGSEIAYSVTTLRDGGFALVGGCEGNFYIVITDENGIGRSARTYDNGGHEIARALVESIEGGFFLVGSTMENNSYQSDIWLVRTDLSGEETWTFEIEGKNIDSAWDVVEPETGGFIILGNTMSSGSGKYDAVLYRIDPWENVIWEIYAGDSLWNTGSCLSINSEGNLFFAGKTESAESGLFSSWLVHTSPEDLLNW